MAETGEMGDGEKKHLVNGKINGLSNGNNNVKPPNGIKKVSRIKLYSLG